MMKVFWIVFISVFLAELGDKTQLATLSFAASSRSSSFPWIVFIASSLALVLSSFLGVLVGGVLQKYLNPLYLQLLAGVLFIVIGLLMLFNVRGSFKEQKYKEMLSLLEEIQQQSSQCLKCQKLQMELNMIEADAKKYVEEKLGFSLKGDAEIPCGKESFCSAERFKKSVKNLSKRG